MSSLHPDYRPDIDGLRAVAVLAVVAYHFQPAWVHAGFVGVDVFFVISGFLISRIILREAERGTFSLAGFYLRRVRRIFPGLLLVLLACLAAGWAALYFSEYGQLGWHVAAGAAFFNNFVLWSETGYFDAAAETKPLLHLWSLGVEEQFYLVWPLVLAWFCRQRRSRLATTGVLLAASFVASLVALTQSPAAAFYLPVFRFWELMAGAVLAQMGTAPRTARQADLLAAAAAALLLACHVVIQPGSPFPGWRAVLPVAAACALIAAGPQAFLNRRLLASRPMVAIGLISFPLYLWHWPLLSFYRILGNDAPLTFARTAALLALSLGLAWATYRFVEQPLRRGNWGRWKAGGLVAAMTCAGLAGLSVVHHNGWPARPVNDRDPTFSARDGRNATDVREWLNDGCGLPPEEARLFRTCAFDRRAPVRYALTGDSKADALFAGLVRTSHAQGRWMYIGGATRFTSVLPVLSGAHHYGVYQEPARVALREIARRPEVDTVVVVSAARALFHLASASSIDDLPASPFYDDAYQGLSAFVREALGAGKRVVLVADHPTLPDPKRCMRDARVRVSGPVAEFFRVGRPDERCTVAIARHNELAAQYLRLLRTVAAEAPPGRVFVFDTLPFVCDEAAGSCGAYEGAELLYSFADHVSDYAATKIGRSLNAFLAGLDAPAASPAPGPARP